MRSRKIKTFYNIKQVCFDNIEKESYSKSPIKPYLLMKHIKDIGLSDMLDVEKNFTPFRKNDFRIAHTKRYVDNFFRKKGNYRSNGIPWSRNLVNSVCWTNSALYHANKFSIQNPETVTFAPVSGMHHAQPSSGSGFCTFSGQVISSIKLYEEYGVRGAYFDLDGHFGNSIEDTRQFRPILNKAIPKGCNINPSGIDKEYLQNFDDSLTYIGREIFAGSIHYVVFAHGADSHIHDDLGNQCNTETWVACAELFAHWVNEISYFMGKPLPVTLTLFGGYRKDDYESVLNLHCKSLIRISNIICGNSFIDNLKITEKENEPIYTFEVPERDFQNV